MRKSIRIAALLASLLIVVFPFNQTIAPDWVVYTLDANRKPLQNIPVTEIWQQYSLEREFHEEKKKTDERGRVHFDRKMHRSSLAQRFLGCVMQVGLAGAHASCGRRASLVTNARGVVDTLDWSDLDQLNAKSGRQQETILVRRW